MIRQFVANVRPTSPGDASVGGELSSVPVWPLSLIALGLRIAWKAIAARRVKNLILGFAVQVSTTRRKDFSSQTVFQPDIEWGTR